MRSVIPSEAIICKNQIHTARKNNTPLYPYIAHLQCQIYFINTTIFTDNLLTRVTFVMTWRIAHNMWPSKPEEKHPQKPGALLSNGSEEVNDWGIDPQTRSPQGRVIHLPSRDGSSEENAPILNKERRRKTEQRTIAINLY